MNARLLALAAALAALVLAAGAGRAAAGTYTVQSCHSADGAPLPVSDAAGGWRPEYGAGSFAENRCDGGAGLVATVGGNVPVDLGAQALWRFVPPAGTFVSGFRIAYAGYA